MSYLYRPTPVFNPGPSRGIPLSGAVSGGAMHGYQANINWRGFFDEARRACAGKPWVVRSGTMGSFLGQDDGFDYSSLPLTPYDPSIISLDPLPMPELDYSSLPLAPYDPSNISLMPPISSGGSILNPVAQIINSASSAGTQIVRAVTGQSSPTITPLTLAQQQAALLAASGTSWFSGSTVIPGLPNWGVLAGGLAVVAIAASFMSGGRKR